MDLRKNNLNYGVQNNKTKKRKHISSFIKDKLTVSSFTFMLLGGITLMCLSKV